MFSERDMENSIVADPEKYLGEKGLRLISQQYRIGNYIFDLLFEDRHGAKMIVEIQKGTLDRAHTYKILDYYHEYKEKNPEVFIELMVIANKIPDERKKRLSDWGVSCKEFPEADFIKRKDGAMNQDQRDQDACGAVTAQGDSLAQTSTESGMRLVGLPASNPKFESWLAGSNEEIQDIFLDLVNRFVRHPIRHTATAKPDYRLSKKYVFCEFVLHKKSLQINLRVDSHHLSSSLIELVEMSGKTSPGKRWYKLRLSSRNQIEEAVRLIEKVYEFSE